MKVPVFVLTAVLLIASPSQAQVNLGTSTGANNPQRNGEATTGLYSPASGDVAVTSTGTEIMRITGTGVGIGTTSPCCTNSSRLDVEGTGFNYIQSYATDGEDGGFYAASITSGGVYKRWAVGSQGGTGSFFINEDYPSGSTFHATPRFFILQGTGNVGIGTNAPDSTLSFDGQSTRTIDVIRETTASAAGNNLTIQAGGAIVSGTNLNGGTLNLTSGISTGTGSSGINLNIYPAGSSGSSDNSPTTVMALTGSGLNLISGVYQVNGTQIAASNLLNGVTGSGNIVLAISPTLTTPNIGAATGSSLSVTGNITTSGGQIGVGTTAPTAGAALDLSYNTNSMLLPVGTTGQEPASPVNGMMRYNSSTPGVEAYYNGAWNSLGVAPSGSQVLLSAQTASSSSSISFTSIPSGYDQYIVTLTNIVPATNGAQLYMQVGEGGGCTIESANYSWWTYAFNHSGASASGNTSDSQIHISSNGGGVANSPSGIGVTGALNINSLASSSLYKQVVGNVTYLENGSSDATQVVSGRYTGDTNSITCLKFFFSSGNISSGDFALYGLKKS
jgi:hypothetical protein